MIEERMAMGNPHDPADTEREPVDPVVAARLERARRRYQAAYDAGEEGGTAPTVEVDLAADSGYDDLPEPARSELRRALAELDREYRERAAGRMGSTLTYRADPAIPVGSTLGSDPGTATEADLSAGRPPWAVDGELPPTVAGLFLAPGSTVDFGDLDGSTLVGSAPVRGSGGGRLPRIDGYEVIRELKRGGMGVVYMARQVDADRLVAIKMILDGDHADDDQIARFADDSRLAAQLDDPGIVRIYQVGRKDGLPFFSLEYIDGGSLADLLADREHGGPRKPLEAGSLVERLARSMQVAHDLKIIHRDLKPGNVLMTRKGEPKITDFGLAKRLDGDGSGNRTQTGQVMGTPNYMAPEQARGASTEIGPLADVYALGAILYELLTGRPPFQGVTIWDTLDQVLTQEPVSPRRLQPKVPSDLETICLKCLQKDPARRYESAAALADDLGRFVRDEPIRARPVSTTERTLRWCRRNPRVASLVGTIFLLLVAITIGSIAAVVNIERIREKTQDNADLAKRNAAVARANEARAKEYAALADEQVNVVLETLRGLLAQFKTQIPDSPGGRKLKASLLTYAFQSTSRALQIVAGSTIKDRGYAAIHQQYGRLFEEEGRTSEALSEFEKSHEIVESLWRRNPHEYATVVSLAGIKNELADLIALRLRDLPRARALYTEALRLREAMLTDEPESEVIKDQVANSHGLVAGIALQAGDLAAARREYDEETKLRDSLAPATAGGTIRRRERAGQYDKLCSLFLKHGDFATARAYAESAMAIRRAIPEVAESSRVRRDVAISCANLGDLLMRDPATAGTEAVARAASLYREAIAILDAILKDEPDIADNVFTLAIDRYRLGLALVASHSPNARAEFVKARDLLAGLAAKDAKNLQAKVPLALATARAGDHARAADALAELVKALARNPGDLYDIACGYSGCASTAPADLALSYAAKAVAVLRQAKDLGWADLAALQTDPDLAEIRPHPEYARLVADLKAALPATRP